MLLLPREPDRHSADSPIRPGIVWHGGEATHSMTSSPPKRSSRRLIVGIVMPRDSRIEGAVIIALVPEFIEQDTKGRFPIPVRDLAVVACMQARDGPNHAC